jgi:pyrroline-5-carboxylate reductase
MGGALLSRWREADGFRFTVVSPSGRRPIPEGVRAVRSADELGEDQFDMLVIATKPQSIESALPAYRHLLAPGGCLLSMAAGFSIDSLQAIAPGVPAIRIMPNLPVMIGKGVSALYADDSLNDKCRLRVEALMAPTGHLVWAASEDELDRVTAVAGSGPGYAFEIARCWADACEALGFSKADARELVLKTLAGSVDLALATDTPLDELRDGVTSKNGTTQAGLSVLNGDAQLGGLLGRTVEAAYARAVELR